MMCLSPSPSSSPNIQPHQHTNSYNLPLHSLSEFLSLFTPPSEPILIYNNHLDSSNNQSNNSSHSSSPVRTTSSTPLSSSSSSSTSPISKPTIHLAHHKSIDPVPIFPQPGLAVAPNHLSTIVCQWYSALVSSLTRGNWYLPFTNPPSQPLRSRDVIIHSPGTLN